MPVIVVLLIQTGFNSMAAAAAARRPLSGSCGHPLTGRARYAPFGMHETQWRAFCRHHGGNLMALQDAPLQMARRHQICGSCDGLWRDFKCNIPRKMRDSPLQRKVHGAVHLLTFVDSLSLTHASRARALSRDLAEVTYSQRAERAGPTTQTTTPEKPEAKRRLRFALSATTANTASHGSSARAAGVVVCASLARVVVKARNHSPCERRTLPSRRSAVARPSAAAAVDWNSKLNSTGCADSSERKMTWTCSKVPLLVNAELSRRIGGVAQRQSSCRS